MWHQFRSVYPEAAIISDLITIDHGLYVVRVMIEIKGVTLATGLAAANTLETAEDRARDRALDLLPLDLPSPIIVDSEVKEPKSSSIFTYIRESQELVTAKEDTLKDTKSEPELNLQPQATVTVTEVQASEVPSRKQRTSKKSGVKNRESDITPVETIPEVETPAIITPVVTIPEIEREVVITPQGETETITQIETEAIITPVDTTPEVETETIVTTPETIEQIETESVITPVDTTPEVETETVTAPLETITQEQTATFEQNLLFNTESIPKSEPSLPEATITTEITEETLPITEITQQTIPEPEKPQETIVSAAPLDFSEIMARIDLEMKRLDWTKEQGKEYLIQTYGKRSRQALSDEELLEFLNHLESQSQSVTEVPSNQPKNSVVSTNALDFKEVMARTDIEIKRLGWTKEQGKNYLVQTYGKQSRQLLSDQQLLEFLHYLESLPNPV